MPFASPSSGQLRGPNFRTPGQGPDLVPPAAPRIAGSDADPAVAAVAAAAVAYTGNLWRQPVDGCVVVAGSGLTVNVNGGLIAYDGAHANVPGVSGITLAAADAALDRYDTVVVDSSGIVSVITGTAGQVWSPGSIDATKIPLAVVPVLAGATSVSSVYDVRVTPERLAAISTPPHVLVSDTFPYTFLAAAQAGDPGSGNLGFDTTSIATLTTLYVSYQNAGWGQVGSAVYTKLVDWLSGPNSRGSMSTSFYLRLWSRKSPNVFMLLTVTAVADHSTYATLTVSSVIQTQPDLGGVGTAVLLSTDPLDTIIEYAGPVGGGVTTFNTRTGAVTLTKADVTGTGLAASDVGAAATGVLKTIANVLNGTTSYTPSSGTTVLYVECQAGGGSSGNCGTSTSAGGGGGGGYSASRISSVNVTSHTVAVGAGGNTGASGNSGGTTSFTKAGGEAGTAPSANGGAAGGAAATSAGGGAGGAVGTGDVAAAGGGGGSSFWYATGTIGNGGPGGNSYFGSGGGGVASATTSRAGGLYGGGASGASNQATASAAGGNGVLRIWEFA